MKRQLLTNDDLGGLCLSLSHLFHAGIGPGDALDLLAGDQSEAELKSLLSTMARQADDGVPLAAIVRGAGCFPLYLCALLDVGQQVGRTEETLQALARYYDGRARLQRQVRSALLYPAVLLAVLLAVVGALLMWVLPVFNDVYIQLGSRLTGVAGALLRFGALLRQLMPVLCVLLALAVVFCAALALSPALRDGLSAQWRRVRDDRGLSGQLSRARFVQALSMALSSGFTAQEGVELARTLAEGSPKFQQRCQTCLTALEDGQSLAHALRETGLMPPAQCRLLEAGMRSGSGPAVLEQIAQRLLEESETALEAQVSRIEPTLVVLLSVLVGIILLSVMLPLTHIMTAIG